MRHPRTLVAAATIAIFGVTALQAQHRNTAPRYLSVNAVSDTVVKDTTKRPLPDTTKAPVPDTTTMPKKP